MQVRKGGFDWVLLFLGVVCAASVAGILFFTRVPEPPPPASLIYPDSDGTPLAGVQPRQIWVCDTDRRTVDDVVRNWTNPSRSLVLYRASSGRGWAWRGEWENGCTLP